MRVGMLFLLLASLSRRFLHPNAVMGEDLTDGVTGLFYGLAIGLLLWSVRRSCPPSSRGPVSS